MPRPRRRAVGFVGGALVLFVVGTSVQAGWLLVLASCLLGAAIAGLVLPRRMVTGIEVERRAPAEAFQGDEVRVDLVVSNAAKGVRLALEVLDEHLEPATAYVSILTPRDVVVVETTRTARSRGPFDSSAVVLASAAPFGVAERRRRVEVSSRTIVYPRLIALDELTFLESTPTPERAMHTMPRRGAGPDYLGIREYRTGDSLRHVHWRSTARHGEVMVREFEREQTRRLVVVVDSLADAGEGAGETPLDRCCSIAASVAFAAHASGQGVRLVSASGGRPVWLARSDPHALLEALAGLRPGGGLALGDLAGRLGSEVLGAETVLLVLPTWRANGVEALGDAVADLVSRAPRVVAALVDANTFAHARPAPRLDPSAVAALEDRLVRDGVWVYRVGAETDLRSAFARNPVRREAAR